MRYLLVTLAALIATSVLVYPLDATAQDEPPPPPPPVEDLDPMDDTRSESMAAPSADASAERDVEQQADTSQKVEPFSAGRASVEVLTGLGLMLGGTLSGLLGGFLVGSIAAGPGSVEAGVAAGIGGLLGYGIGTPVGVWLGGNAMNGNGSLWTTTGGFLGGVLVGGATTLVVSAGTGTNGGGAFWLTALPITGAIIGYEVSSGPKSEDSGVSLRIGPSPAPSGKGTLLNLSGRW